MSVIRNTLSKPYGLEQDTRRRWLSCFLFGGFVFVFLFTFRPFQLDEVDHATTICLGYGLTTFFIMAVLNVLLVPLFPAFFDETGWTVGREILWSIVNVGLIGVANALYSAYVQLAAFHWKNILLFEGYTIAVGVFPVVVSVLIREARLAGKYRGESDQISQALLADREDIPKPASAQTISIVSATGSESLSINTEDFRFIKSDDNYVEVFFMKGTGLERKVVRNTLKNVLGQTAAHAGLYRCHKSYIVDLHKVVKVSGNAQGYRLHLRDTDATVPVSRQNNEEIRARFSR